MSFHLEALSALSFMISVERCRQLAPEMTKPLTDEEVAALCQSFELLAEIALEVMLHEEIADSQEENE